MERNLDTLEIYYMSNSYTIKIGKVTKIYIIYIVLLQLKPLAVILC